MQRKPLTQRQQAMIDQVAASMAIEDMPLSERCYENLREMLAGEKSEEQAIEQITGRYAHA